MRPPGVVRAHRQDLLISAAVFVCALGVRWPHLMSLPAFSDESLEVRWGMDIALGRRWPLTGYDAYYGPLFSYLIAAGFKCFGFHLALPRTMIAVCGALTVTATYWCGRLLHGRWTGVLASVMAASSPALALYSSHYAWSNSLTPLFATLAFTALSFAIERRSRALLAVGGLLAGLTIQTHPLTMVAFAGTAMWLIYSARRSDWLGTAELTALAAWSAVGYAPVIAANIVRPLISLRLATQRTYAFAPTVSPGEYLSRLLDLVRTFVDMLAGGLAFERIPASPVAFVLAGAVLLWIVAADWVKGKRLIASWLLATVLLLPFFVKLFIPRYLTFLLPLAFVGAAAAIAGSGRRITEADLTWANPRRRITVTALAGVLLTVSAYPFVVMRRYTTAALANGLSNAGYFALRDALAQRHACGPQLFVEEAGRPLIGPSWVGLYAVDHVLSLSGCKHQLMTAEKTLLALQGQEEAWVVLSNDTASRWPGQWTLAVEFPFGAPAGFERVPITLYRIRRGELP